MTHERWPPICLILGLSSSENVWAAPCALVSGVGPDVKSLLRTQKNRVEVSLRKGVSRCFQLLFYVLTV